MEAGKEADFICVDPSSTTPVEGDAVDDAEEIASRLIYRTRPQMVRGAWVRGRASAFVAARLLRRSLGLAATVDQVDILIRGGTVVDGTGAPGFSGDVAVSGDRLRLVRRARGQ